MTSPQAAAWTVEEAAEQFAAAGVPVEAGRLRLIIRGLGWTPSARGKSGPKGGRGEAMYPIRDWQYLHTVIRPWVAAGGPPGRHAPDSGGRG